MNTQEHEGTSLNALLLAGQRTMTPRPSNTDWLTPVRERGAAAVAEMPLPSRKDEAWRYTSVGFLEQVEYQPVVEGPFDAIQPSDIDDLLLPQSQGPRLVFVNGYLATGVSDLAHQQEGIQLRSLAGGLGDVSVELRRHLDGIAKHRHVFAALNSALMSDGALIHVGRDVSARAPIEILHISIGMEEPGISHPRHLIVLESGARAEVTERYACLGDARYFNNALVEVALGADSELLHMRLQEESPQAQHLSDLQVRLGERSRYRLVLAALGGAWSRSDVRVTFDGEGAAAELDGLMLARDQQINDVHLDVQHLVPHCTSREAFKGILDGKGRVVFDGRILVAQDAQKTDAQLSNDNLMLSRSAEVDTKPQLEIYADDVKCSHGTTVGELDANMLFYLRSRGIPQARAKQMLCQGFAEEVMAHIDNEPLRAYANKLLTARLAQTTE
ncbi:MAG: Fe-S cluster assembly protein SufD [Chromatiaceae bacterium]|jgi:Fe-S cluster assembly protein SufD